MVYRQHDGDGGQALDQNQLARRLQFSVQSGCEVSPGTDDLTVACGSGSVIVDGDRVDVAAQDNTSLASPHADYPRKDVVYIDAAGALQVATGVPEAAQPPDQIGAQTYRPAPPDLSATDAVVLAEVWVAPTAPDVDAGDIRDRRLMADAAFRDVDAESVSAGELVLEDGGELGLLDGGNTA